MLCLQLCHLSLGCLRLSLTLADLHSLLSILFLQCLYCLSVPLLYLCGLITKLCSEECDVLILALAVDYFDFLDLSEEITSTWLMTGVCGPGVSRFMVDWKPESEL